MSVTRRAVAVLLGLILFTGLLGGIPTEHTGGEAEAATVRTTQKQRIRAMRVALAQRGDPYRYGASGPNAFDFIGKNRIVHASRSGTPVKIDPIWTSSYVVRRP